MDASVIVGATSGKNIGNTVDCAGGHERFGFEEGNLAHSVKIKTRGEVSKGFELFDVEVSTEVVAESAGEIGEFGDGEIFGKEFIFDADEDFLLRGAARKVARCGAMTGAG